MPMFPIDLKDLPVLKTRRALLIIDCQNDFLAENSPLHATDPEGFLDGTLELASTFRSKGEEVIWIRTEFKNKVAHHDDEIIISNNAPASNIRGRRRPQAAAPTASPMDPEAFLGTDGSNKEMLCARPGTAGAEFFPAIAKSIMPRDRTFTKSHYSAFQSGELLQQLRQRLVKELYVCGSLFNIGVFATAVDAAQHGYQITLVEDCCGYRSPLRLAKAKKRVVELTGCDIVPLEDAMRAVDPIAAAAREKRLAEEESGSEEQETRDSDDNDESSSDDHGAKATNSVPEASDMPRLSGRNAKGVEDKSSQDTLAPLMAKMNLGAGGYAAVKAPQTQNASSKVDGNQSSPPRQVKDKRDSSVNLAAEGNGTAKKTTDDHLEVDKHQVEREKDEEEGEEDIVQTTGIKDPRLSPRAPSTWRTMNRESDTNSTNSSKGSLVSSRDQNTTTTTEPSSPSTALPSIFIPASIHKSPPKAKDKMAPTATAGEPICEGDANIVHDVLPPDLEDEVFEKLKEEVAWAHMSHQGGEVPRLVAVQGEVAEDGSYPVYRHPSDESPPLFAFTPTVRAIKDTVERCLNHPLNHVLIQWYRDGHDYISEHSDKTLDISPNTYIVNVSLGAQRTMVLRTKKQPKKAETDLPPTTPTTLAPEGPKRQAVRVPLPHNSMFCMGLETNMRWLHGIRQDKRTDKEKTAAELAFGAARISLTFRKIGTFMDKTSKLIWGQGATGKSRDEAHAVINGQTPEAIQMLRGFGTENHASEFDWKAHYGGGFNVLHMHAAARLFTSPDPTANYRVQIMLAELGISYARGSISSGGETVHSAEDVAALLPTGTPIMFVDNDDARSVVSEEMAIITYLDMVYGEGKLRRGTRSNAQLALELNRFHQAFHLGRWWREVGRKEENKNHKIGKLRKALAKWDSYLETAKEKEEETGEFVCGQEMSISDVAFWPTLEEIVRDEGVEIGVLAPMPQLQAYYERIRDRESVVGVLGEKLVEGDGKEAGVKGKEGKRENQGKD